ncbi:MAG: 3-phosphoserine/phosphohydroxythreonine aminotransferase [Acidiferrobacteraceae bacterium]|nr:3-phosphoserine/phosphohydroxythreonine aminotransferase [Acidiferrobacteraceae bacterium]|tara:strand:+ start:39915 stop:41003 length:1089 start_codon:yes stop_codon:yes gene_type:complete
MNNRIYNFSAGPCTLPLEVLEEAQAELVDYKGAGMSLIEMSHRGKDFMDVYDETISLTRSIFNVPDDFSVLFLQGGATLQFSMVPMNLLNEGKRAAYVDSGHWARSAITDAESYGDVYVAWDGKDNNYSRMPKTDEIELKDNTTYLHITSNETIGGVRFHEWPEVEVPIVSDMSSDYMSRPIRWKNFGLVYGGVQKNLGPAGLAIVFIRDTLLRDINRNQGKYLRYDIHAEKNSMFNTPPVFPIYIVGKVLKWMSKIGGIHVIERVAEEKARLLYFAIDESNGYYQCPVQKDCRSIMNVVFRLPTPALENEFVKQASLEGLANLKGHRSVGGCRASIYNAMPRDGVETLAAFMDIFQANNPI